MKDEWQFLECAQNF